MIGSGTPKFSNHTWQWALSLSPSCRPSPTAQPIGNRSPQYKIKQPFLREVFYWLNRNVIHWSDVEACRRKLAWLVRGSTPCSVSFNVLSQWIWIQRPHHVSQAIFRDTIWPLDPLWLPVSFLMSYSDPHVEMDTAPLHCWDCHTREPDERSLWQSAIRCKMVLLVLCSFIVNCGTEGATWYFSKNHTF